MGDAEAKKTEERKHLPLDADYTTALLENLMRGEVEDIIFSFHSYGKIQLISTHFWVAIILC